MGGDAVSAAMATLAKARCGARREGQAPHRRLGMATMLAMLMARRALAPAEMTLVSTHDAEKPS